MAKFKLGDIVTSYLFVGDALITELSAEYLKVRFISGTYDGEYFYIDLDNADFYLEKVGNIFEKGGGGQ